MKPDPDTGAWRRQWIEAHARDHQERGLVARVRHYFDRRQELWYPARVPSCDLNLFFICHLSM